MASNDLPTTDDLVELLDKESDFSVKVSIEPNHECEIYEIKYNGQEIYKEPLNQSENLAQLISKIDFTGEIFDGDKDRDEKIDASQAPKDVDKEETISARKFYQNIYEKIKLSLDEVSVLLDCLNIAKADKMMGIEMCRLAELPLVDGKPLDVSDKTLNVVLKKKNIDKTKVLLRKTLEKISLDQEYSNIKFHLELYRARQMWRIKKLGTKFFCDLSYRTVGCVNSLKANVELFKNEIPLSIQDQNFKTQQYLSVIVPEELKDYAFIQVQIVKSNKSKKPGEKVFNSKFSLFTGSPYSSTNPNASSSQSWQELLEREQNAIYCKEIYNQLLREIFEPTVTSQFRPIIIGNSIQMMITMNFDLIISLIHNPEKESNFTQQCSSDYNFDNAILEYYLHSLLKKSFDQNFFHYDQRPITSTFAYNGQVKIAGMAYSNLVDDEDSITSLPNNISHLLNKKKKINLLNSIREKAEHLIIRKRILQILNYVSSKVKEPNVIIEPSIWNSSSSTDITVTISSSRFDALAKSSFFIIIKNSNVTVLNRFSNLSVQFTDCVDDMKEYFLDQCCFHQINLVTTMSQLYGWTVLANSFTNEANNMFLSGLALIYNSKYSKKIGIRVGPVNKMEFYVNQFNSSVEGDAVVNTDLKNLLSDLNAEWIYSKDKYVKVDIDYFPGNTLVQKFELFLAYYSSKDYVESK